MKTSSVLSGDALILFTMAIFASSPLFFRFNPNIPVALFLAAFQIVGALCFFFIAKYQGIPTLSRYEYILLGTLALAAVLNDLCYFFALRLTSVANAAVGHQSVSLFLLVLSPIFLKEKTTRAEWLVLVVSIVGIVLLYSDGLEGATGDDHLLGITLAVISGFFYASIIILYRIIPAHNRTLTIPVINFWRYTISCILLLPFINVVTFHTVGSTDIVTLVLFGFIFAVIASGIHNHAISMTRSLHVSILGKSEPVFAVIYSMVFLHETPKVSAVVGGAFIIIPSLWLMLYGKKEQS